MIQIKTRGPINSEFADWRVRAEKARDEMLREFRETGKVPDPDRYQPIWRELKERFLIKVFRSKCAFCEARLSPANFPPDVEHYRPKKGVTAGRTAIEHTGYFWLACEWYNLLLACRNCNSAHTDGVSHPGKATEFPVEGERIGRPSDDPAKWESELKAERPLLLHPYYDRPQKHIAFSDLGVPYPKDSSKHGRATIEACHLDRESLCSERIEHANELVQKRLYAVIAAPKKKKFVRPEDPFSAWLQHAVPGLVTKILNRGGLVGRISSVK